RIWTPCQTRVPSPIVAAGDTSADGWMIAMAGSLSIAACETTNLQMIQNGINWTDSAVYLIRSSDDFPEYSGEYHAA
ncbi:MAG TPA: hypothetical protein PKA05_20625, partial [Roseiflexaceae bacterium]|nr:hypothetical protein [Roseiflexaceae bacterium]